MAYSERELIARMIQCEAGGEGDNGMKAVASVIMNRVNVPNGEYAILETYYFNKDNLTVQEKLYVEAITVKTYIT